MHPAPTAPARPPEPTAGAATPPAPADRHAVGRRAVLLGLGAGVAGAAFAAGPLARPLAAQAGGGLATETVELVAFLQSVELAAAEVTGRIAGRLTDGGASAIVSAFSRHHREHAGAMHALTGTRGADGANGALVAELGRRIGSATQEQLLQAAFDLELELAATHLSALGSLSEQDPSFTVASILPIETSHSVVLGQLLELPPRRYLPSFETVDAGFTPERFPL